MLFNRATLLAFALIALTPGVTAAAPTPVPGGANAVSALSAKSGDTIFNGVLRIKVLALRDVTDADDKPNQPSPSADQKIMYLQTLLHNGKTDTFTDLLTYTLPDADAVSVEVPSSAIQHANPSILQAAAVRPDHKPPSRSRRYPAS